MEDKLYFRPADYGKGLKSKTKKQKQSEKVRGDTNDGDKPHRLRNLIIFALIFAIIVTIILWLLRGKTTTTGQYPANVRNESLNCVAKNRKYSKLTRVISEKSEMKIDAVFGDDEKLKNLSLLYTMYLDSEKAVRDAENLSNAELGKGLAAAGFATTAFSNKFAKYNDRMTVSLTASASQIDEFSAPFFDISQSSGNKLPSSLNDYKNYYESAGYTCTSSEKDEKEK